MSPIQNLRKSLASVVIFSLLITGLLPLTVGQSYASNNSLRHSLTPTVNEPSEKGASQTIAVDEATRRRVSEAYNKLPLSFEENRGQVDREVKYLSRSAGYTLFLTPTEAVLALRQSDGKETTTTDEASLSPIPMQSQPTLMSALRMKLSGAKQSPSLRSERERGVKINYFKGNDPQKWQTDVARYERVRYAQVYPGIDMIYYGQQQSPGYDFEVAPGADSRRIALEFTGVKQVEIERETGDLLLKIEGVEVRQRKPVAYQEVGGERRTVASRYVAQGERRVGIEVGEYDRTKRLVINPVLSYSTYPVGGVGNDTGAGIPVDSSGFAGVTGRPASSDFPLLKQYQTDQEASDAFVMKDKAAGQLAGVSNTGGGAPSPFSDVVNNYSTYLGAARVKSSTASPSIHQVLLMWRVLPIHPISRRSVAPRHIRVMVMPLWQSWTRTHPARLRSSTAPIWGET